MKKEIEIQESVRKYLEDREIYPFSVIFTNEFNGILSITLYTIDDLNEILDTLGYKSMCDKSGFTIEKNTLLLSGMALMSFLYNEKKY